MLFTAERFFGFCFGWFGIYLMKTTTDEMLTFCIFKYPGGFFFWTVFLFFLAGYTALLLAGYPDLIILHAWRLGSLAPLYFMPVYGAFVSWRNSRRALVTAFREETDKPPEQIEMQEQEPIEPAVTFIGNLAIPNKTADEAASGVTRDPETGERTCPSGHKLASFEAKGGKCDGCKAKVSLGTEVKCCKRCNWYLCQSCFDRPLEAKTHPSARRAATEDTPAERCARHAGND